MFGDLFFLIFKIQVSSFLAPNPLKAAIVFFVFGSKTRKTIPNFQLIYPPYRGYFFSPPAPWVYAFSCMGALFSTINKLAADGQ